jgi:ComF family protein
MLEGCRALGARMLDAVLPPRCLCCAAPVLSQGTLCQSCFCALSLIGPPWCDRCGLPFLHAGQGSPPPGARGLQCQRCLEHPPAFGQARAAWLYDEGSKRLLLPFKHFDRTELAEPLARQMARAGRALLARAELILPVPLHRWRLLSRRYNQSALLAARLARHSGLPWAPDLLRRRHATPPLGGFGAAERAVLLEDVFCLAGRGRGRVAGRRLLLVDDVMTSGATASACARVLLGAGARAVDVLAAARVPDPRLAEPADGSPVRDTTRDPVWTPP